MASSLELGPGIRLLAPRRSRNFSRESHFLRRTSSSSIMAMCAAVPPKAVVPRRRKNRASSVREPRLAPPAAAAWLGGRSDIGIRFVSGKPSVQRQTARARKEQEDQSQEHGVVCARCVLHGPKAVF